MDDFDLRAKMQKNEPSKLDNNLETLHELISRVQFLLKNPTIRGLLDEQRELKPSSQHAVITSLGALLKEIGPWFSCRFSDGKDQCQNELSGIDYLKSTDPAFHAEQINIQKAMMQQTQLELLIGGQQKIINGLTDVMSALTVQE